MPTAVDASILLRRDTWEVVGSIVSNGSFVAAASTLTLSRDMVLVRDMYVRITCSSRAARERNDCLSAGKSSASTPEASAGRCPGFDRFASSAALHYREHRYSTRGVRDPPGRGSARPRVGIRQPDLPRVRQPFFIRSKPAASVCHPCAIVSTEHCLVRIVDDDEPVRRSVGELLQSVGFAVIGYGSAHAFLADDPPDVPGCLVLDVQLPGLSGLELQRKLLGTERALPIVFLTGCGDIPTSVRAMKDGAVEFLTKPVSTGSLLEAVRHAVEKDCQERDERKKVRALRGRYESLTPRERDVMQRIIAGRLNKQIAAEFGTSEPTVKEQRAQVMQKMQAQSLIALARMAERLGL
jgi:FixJ family two-component response regulator